MSNQVHDMSASTTGSWPEKRTSRFTFFSAAQIPITILALLIAFFVLYPILSMFGVAFFRGGSLQLDALASVSNADWLLGTLLDTVIVVATSGVLAILFGTLLAWLNERTNARMGFFGDLLPLVPLLVPSVAMAIGWVFLASPGSGFINGVLNVVLVPLGLKYSVNVWSWTGVILVYTLHAVPYVYLVVGAAIRNMDTSLEESARMSGAGVWKTFKDVNMPAILPSILAASLLVSITGFSNYSIPAILAERADISMLSVRVFLLLHEEYPPKLDQAALLASFLLVIIAGIWALQRVVLARGRFAAVGGKATSPRLVNLHGWRWVARAGMALFFLMAAVLPMAGLIVVSLQPYWQSVIDVSQLTFENYIAVFQQNVVTRAAFVNSAILSGTAGLVAISVAALMAIYAGRKTSILAPVVDVLMKLPAAFSHLAIAVGFMVAFAGPPFGLGGTVWLLLLAYIVLYIPEASIAATSAHSQIGRDLLESSAMSGASPGRTIAKIQLPLMLPGLASGWALLFVLCAGEITASALLATVAQPVIGFVILSAWTAGHFGTLAALAAGFALMNAVVVMLAYLIGRRPHLRST